MGYPLWISIIIGVVANCVGEGVLLPILEEYGLLNKPLGKYALSIGVLDDILEVFALGLVLSFIAWKSTINLELWFFSILFLVISTFVLIKTNIFKKYKLLTPRLEFLILVGLAILFIFVGVGKNIDAEGLGAILAGVATRNLVPKKEMEEAEEGLKVLIYSFFGPLFFAWVGSSLKLSTIVQYPLVTLLFFLVPEFGKIATTYIFTRKELKKESFTLGVALSTRFSTEMVVAQLLYINGLIDSVLFTGIVASSMLATVLNPLLLTWLLRKK